MEPVLGSFKWKAVWGASMHGLIDNGNRLSARISISQAGVLCSLSSSPSIITDGINAPMSISLSLSACQKVKVWFVYDPQSKIIDFNPTQVLIILLRGIYSPHHLESWHFSGCMLHFQLQWLTLCGKMGSWLWQTAFKVEEGSGAC